MANNSEKAVDAPHNDLVSAIVQATMSDAALVEMLTPDACRALQNIFLKGELSPSELIAAANKQGEVE